MKIPQRILEVEFIFPESGGEAESVKITQDLSLDISVRTQKDIVHLQNQCTINVFGLRQDIRQRLLTAFTAWNNRKQPTVNYVQVRVYASYKKDESTSTTRIFIGDIVKCNIGDVVPNSMIVIEAYTRQVDRSNFIPANIPTSATFKEIVEAVGQAAGLRVDCDTSFDGDRQTNNFAVIQVNPIGQPLRLSVQAAIAGLWRLYPDRVAIWVDDDALIARDVGKTIAGNVPTISTFIDNPPSWTEWGVIFKTMFSADLKVAGGVRLKSVMNTGVNGDSDTGYVITSLEYDLASRQKPFYVTVKATPPAK